MKRHNAMRVSLFVPILMLFSGCLDIDVRTVISSDGSSERIVTVKRDTTLLPPCAVPAAADSTWSVEWKKATEGGSKYQYTARKRFQTPEDLMREYAAAPGTTTVSVRVTLNKTFEWFYTYFDYSEVYTYHNLYKNVPVSEYLTKEEIEEYQHGKEIEEYQTTVAPDGKGSTAQLKSTEHAKQPFEEKVKEWRERNSFEELYRPIIAEIQRRNDPALPASLLNEKKEELFRDFMASDTSKKAGKDAGAKMKGTKKSPDDPVSEGADEALKGLKQIFKTDAVLSLRPVIKDAIAAVLAKDDAMKSPDSWVNSVQMPGLVLESNSRTVEGNTVTWKFKAGQVKVADYVMHAGSRVRNIWAYVVTGLVALVVVFLAVRTAFRRRARAPKPV